MQADELSQACAEEYSVQAIMIEGLTRLIVPLS
jgi:hypothetical protein